MNSRTIQNEIGTWLATWHANENTPPMEEREWHCPKCYREWDEVLRQIPPTGWINWNEAAKTMGQEKADEARRILQHHRISCWERVKDVGELRLLTDVHCRHCGIQLNCAPEALVEVY
jgi:hypothetical protein